MVEVPQHKLKLEGESKTALFFLLRKPDKEYQESPLDYFDLVHKHSNQIYANSH